ncbi:MAG: 5-(carboxyamino)imidazole ribonucleotide mutase [Planctomycetota bacterium]|nr:5-(carboxyamino)imidazole ribonucleotide mutase [Planctomycetota bacterium]
MADYRTTDGAIVSVLMGSASDWPTMKKASETLDTLGIPHECNAISAHRNHERLGRYLADCEQRGIKIYICAAGGAAHLAGVVAAMTHRPVLGCPMKAWSLEGLDSLLSTVQMPKGIPVATFAIGSAGAINAALYAGHILALSDDAIENRLLDFRKKQSETVQELAD